MFNGFWAGFENPETGAPTLDKTPDYVDVVTLAFSGPGANNSYNTNYLCKWYSASTIQGWVRKLQARGQKVLLSVYDNKENHWHDIDIPLFVKNAVPVIREWGVDGIDIDGESGNATSDDMIQLVKCFRDALGSKGSPGAMITYDTFAFSKWDKEILSSTKDDVDWFNLMAYFRLYDSMIQLFNNYASIVPSNLLTIGVKPGRGGHDQATRLPEVEKLSAYQPDSGHKRGMMLYNLSIDTPHFTDHPTFTWTQAIHQNLTR